MANMKELMLHIFEKLRDPLRRAQIGHYANDLDGARWISGDSEDGDALSNGKVLYAREIPGNGPIVLLRWKTSVYGAIPTHLADALQVENSTWFGSESFNRGLGSLVLAHETCLVR